MIRATAVSEMIYPIEKWKMTYTGDLFRPGHPTIVEIAAVFAANGQGCSEFSTPMTKHPNETAMRSFTGFGNKIFKFRF